MRRHSSGIAAQNLLSRIAVWLVSAALFAALTFGGLYAVAGLSGGTLPKLDPRLFEPRSLALIALFLAVYFLADCARLFFVLRALAAEISFARVLPLVFINILFSNITPLATGGGFAQVWYLQRRGVAIGTSAAATTIRTILAMLVIFIAAPFFQMIAPATGVSRLSSVLSQSIAVFSTLYFAGFMVFLLRPSWILKMLDGVFTLLSRARLLSDARRQRWNATLRVEMKSFAGGFRQFLGAPLGLSLAATLSTLVFLLVLFAFPALLMTLLDTETDWLAVIGTLSVVTFLMYFAPTPGGAGFSELAFAGLMAGRIAPEELVLIIFAWRFLTIYLGMAIGVVVSVVSLRAGAQDA